MTMSEAQPTPDLMAKLESALPDLKRRYQITKLGLFGSYSKGEQTAQSDLDVLVDFAELPTLIELISLEQELEQLLGVEIDLVTNGALHGYIGERIKSEVQYL